MAPANMDTVIDGRLDRWLGAGLAGVIGVVLTVELVRETPWAVPIAGVFLVPALTLSVGPTVLGDRLVFFSLFLPRAWRLSRITDLEVRPHLALQGTTYGIRVERQRRVGRRFAFVASSYSGSYGLVERRMLRMCQLLRARGVEVGATVEGDVRADGT